MEGIIRSIVAFNNARLFVVIVSVVHSLMSIKYNINRHHDKSYGDSLETISLRKMWRVDLCYSYLIHKKLGKCHMLVGLKEVLHFSSDDYTIKIIN